MNEAVATEIGGSTVATRIAQTAAGPVEFELTGGDGPVVLASHGGLGGVDQARAILGWLGSTRYRRLAVSRPGYLGTPLTSGRDLEAQADLFAALLDVLGVPRAAVVALSAGAPVAYVFAARHPRRTSALIVIDGVSGRHDPPPPPGAVVEALFISGWTERLVALLARRTPAWLLRQTLRGTSFLPPADVRAQTAVTLSSPEQLAFFRAFMSTITPYRPRQAGTDNDTALQRRLPALPLDRIESPTLVIHGTHDADVPLYHGVHARESIRGAAHIWIDRGSHLGFWLGPHAKATQQAAEDFLHRVA